jgi:ActR/RegA family two-component response regulator
MSRRITVDCPEHLSMAYVKEQHIDSVLASVNGNKSQAALILRVDRRTLYRWLADRKASK